MPGRRRYVNTTISKDALVAKLANDYGDFAALLYTWLIPHAEDDCSLPLDHEEIRIGVVPGLKKRKLADVTKAIDGMVALGLLMQGDGCYYFPPDSFYKHQSYIKEERRRRFSLDSPQNSEDPRFAPKVAQSAASVSVPISVPVPVSSSFSSSVLIKEESERARAPSHPFAFAYAKKYQAKNAGRPPPPTQHAEAVALEAEHGADWCFRAAEAFGWQKQPSYLRPWIIDHKGRSNGDSNGTNIGEPSAADGAGGLATSVGGLEQRGLTIAERRRHRTA